MYETYSLSFKKKIKDLTKHIYSWDATLSMVVNFFLISFYFPLFPPSSLSLNLWITLSPPTLYIFISFSLPLSISVYVTRSPTSLTIPFYITVSCPILLFPLLPLSSALSLSLSLSLSRSLSTSSPSFPHFPPSLYLPLPLLLSFSLPMNFFLLN